MILEIGKSDPALHWSGDVGAPRRTMRLLLTLLVSSALLAVQAVPNLPEQVHIAYGTEHDSISVSWSTPLDSTPSVHYVSRTVGDSFPNRRTTCAS